MVLVANGLSFALIQCLPVRHRALRSKRLSNGAFLGARPAERPLQDLPIAIPNLGSGSTSHSGQ